MQVTIIPLKEKQGQSGYYISVVHICAVFTAAIPIWMSRAAHTTLVWRCDICDFGKFCCKLRRDARIHHMLSAAALNRKRWIRCEFSPSLPAAVTSAADKLIFTMIPRDDLITYLSSYGWWHKQWKANVQNVLSVNFDLYNTINWPKLFSVPPSNCFCVSFQNVLLNKIVLDGGKKLKRISLKSENVIKALFLSSCLKIVLDRTWHQQSKVIKQQV